MLNKLFLIGNLGKDPESKQAGESTICKFSVATTEKIRGEEKTDWHNITAFGKMAEICQKYLKKGSKVYIEGKQQNRSYDDKDGNKKFYSEVVLREIKFLSSVERNENHQENQERVETVDTTYQSATPENDLPF